MKINNYKLFNKIYW